MSVCICSWASASSMKYSLVFFAQICSYDAPLSIEKDVNTISWWKRSVLSVTLVLLFSYFSYLCAGAMCLMCVHAYA